MASDSPEIDLSQDTALLELLRCPRTQQTLRLANPEEHAHWSGLDASAEGFLVTKDGTIAYPIDDGFPILLLERALQDSGPEDS
jgi:uncharacterized protein YbaR (Trm112 family)